MPPPPPSPRAWDEEITIDVFDGLANYMGMQEGWFAKVVKDKFNMNLNIIAPNVAGGGDTLYNTRVAAGDLGDLIITDKGEKLDELIEGGLVADASDYYGSMENAAVFDKAVQKAQRERGRHLRPPHADLHDPSHAVVGGPRPHLRTFCALGPVRGTRIPEHQHARRPAARPQRHAGSPARGRQRPEGVRPVPVQGLGRQHDEQRQAARDVLRLRRAWALSSPRPMAPTSSRSSSPTASTCGR
ncbi:hypothetical protein [Demequina litorisediminis]|uniref:hypothetical protein n=1 Tax=Demequina litorisediminis TaxID=1849022 RepID=UPI0024E16182|nr:hypothetical protein [Demequina litorisediminis]